MNELDLDELTDIQSLDSQEIKIDGVDINQALNETKALGVKYKKRRRLFQLSSVIGSMALVLFVGTLLYLSQGGSPAVDNEIESITETSLPTQTVTTGEVLEVTPTTVVAPEVVEPQNRTIRSFGNPSVCEYSVNPNPGVGEVIIGPSNAVESWNPNVGNTYQVVKSNNETLSVIAKESSQAPNGQYVDLNSGFSTNGTYGNITTFGFRYCEPGLALNISQNAGGYAVEITRW